MKYLLPLLIVVMLLGCNSHNENSVSDRYWSDTDREYLVTNLNSSLSLVLDEVNGLSDEQWNERPDSETWSVSYIVEHLITHDELYLREIRVLSELNKDQNFSDLMLADDDAILGYSEITSLNKEKTPEYLEPIGRWSSKESAIEAYMEVRKALIDFIKSTDGNLRSKYTKSGHGPTEYRDLHQLMLVSIAHTLRHGTQIETVKNSIQLQ